MDAMKNHVFIAASASLFTLTIGAVAVAHAQQSDFGGQSSPTSQPPPVVSRADAEARLADAQNRLRQAQADVAYWQRYLAGSEPALPNNGFPGASSESGSTGDAEHRRQVRMGTMNNFPGATLLSIRGNTSTGVWETWRGADGREFRVRNRPPQYNRPGDFKSQTEIFKGRDGRFYSRDVRTGRVTLVR